MNLQGIEGDSTSEQFRNWFEVSSFSWGETQAASQSGGGGGAGKVHFQDLNITKRAGKGSPLLMLACASGRHLPAVQLVVTNAHGNHDRVFERFTLTDVLISSYQIEGDWASNPTDSLSLNFAKIQFEQAVGRGDGSVDFQSASWDARANKGG
ncbi:Hcp family type VI secretion system effector [Fimbriimonas ginsengisoli]|nr:type VI secretion system tube protein Hcp [Fimbriimonas ginsengisoli]